MIVNPWGSPSKFHGDSDILDGKVFKAHPEVKADCPRRHRHQKGRA